MAVRIMVSGNMQRHSGYREFFVDTVADVATLPNTPEEIMWGAVCLVLQDSSVYVLNSQYQWVPL